MAARKASGKKRKNGVELTFNAIIIATICLIVLVVVVLIFTDFIQTNIPFLKRATECKNQGNGRGNCFPEAQPGMDCVRPFPGCAAQEVCCIPK